MASLFDSDAFNAALFYPQRIASDPPPGARDTFVEVDGARLHLRTHGQQPVTLLLFHGNGEVVADYDDAAAIFAEQAGVSLAVVDFRGYGQSTGTPTLRSALADAHAVLDAVLAEHRPAGRPVVVMGRSLGGQCAAELCTVARAGVVGYVFESAAADLSGIVRRRGITTPPTPEDRATFDTLPKVARCTTPALVLHGEEDALISIDEAVQTAAALSEVRPDAPSPLVRIPGRGHNDVSNHPRYWSALADFVARVRR